jgi:outer membrane protein TolC
MRTTFTTLLILLTGAPLLAQVTLEDCQQKARANYPAIRQYDLIAKSKDYNISNANKAWLPQVSINGIAGYLIQGLPTFPGAEASDPLQFIGIGQLHQTIWDGGASGAQKKIIRANAAIDSATNDVALYAIRDRVNQLYFGILLIDEQLKQISLLKGNLQRNLAAAQLSMQNGLAYQSDVDQVKVEIIKAEQKETEFRSSRAAFTQMLALMTGDAIGEDAAFSKPAMGVLPAVDSIHRPELHLYAHQRLLADAQMKSVTVGYMPKFGLMGAGILVGPGINFGSETINSLAIAGLSLSWNTGGLYRGSNSRQLVKISLDKINNQQETFLFNTHLQLTQAQTEIRKQQTLLQQDDQIVALKESIRKSYELKYRNAMASMNDLLAAESGESDARAARALHEIQYLMSVYNLKTISGN